MHLVWVHCGPQHPTNSHDVQQEAEVRRFFAACSPLSIMFVLWDLHGNRVEGETPFEEPENLLERDASSLQFDLNDIVARVENLGQGKRVTAIHELGNNHHTVLDVILAENTHFVVRIPRLNPDPNLPSVRDKLARECAMMSWISAATSLPIPILRLCDLESPRPLMISDKCPGETAADAFGVLGEEAKIKTLESYAVVSLMMFRVPVSCEIGSVRAYTAVGDSEEAVLDVGPCLDPLDAHSPTSTFASIQQYFQWLIQRKLKLVTQSQRSPEDLDESKAVLKHLEDYLLEACSELDPGLLRLVPSHDDLGPQNILIDKAGNITGVIDWELHLVKPAILAVSYPPWTAYRGGDLYDPGDYPQDPRFSYFYFSNPAEGKMLRERYESVVQKLDGDYYRALMDPKAGVCRAIECWLKQDWIESECRAMKDLLHKIGYTSRKGDNASQN